MKTGFELAGDVMRSIADFKGELDEVPVKTAKLGNSGDTSWDPSAPCVEIMTNDLNGHAYFLAYTERMGNKFLMCFHNKHLGGESSFAGDGDFYTTDAREVPDALIPEEVKKKLAVNLVEA